MSFGVATMPAAYHLTKFIICVHSTVRPAGTGQRKYGGIASGINDNRRAKIVAGTAKHVNSKTAWREVDRSEYELEQQLQQR
jgi:hypothetical protein